MQSRRQFIKRSGQVALGVATLGSASGKIFAAGSDSIRVGAIGCGGRGRGAILDCLASSQGIVITALADPFQDRMQEAVDSIRQWCQKEGRPVDQLLKVTPERMFAGYDGYKSLCSLADVDVVIMAAPPVFRPLHLERAIQAGKHVFMEKPVAVDPPGARRIMAAGQLASQKGLSIVAGTQRRYQKVYRQNAYAVQRGAIGRIVAGRIWWCGGALWWHRREPGETDADYMVRNWVSFVEMSGDHIVEQHVHNIDVANWFIGRPPRMALGFGARARRKTGNQYDFFSVDFDYGEDVTIHSMCRQINGCYNRVSEYFVGTQRSIWADSPMESEMTMPQFEDGNPYVIEHRELIKAVRGGRTINDATSVAEATMAAIMGRISAYTGRLVRWSDLMENRDSQWYDMRLAPTAEDFEAGTVKVPPEDVAPVPGSE